MGILSLISTHSRPRTVSSEGPRIPEEMSEGDLVHITSYIIATRSSTTALGQVFRHLEVAV